MNIGILAFMFAGLCGLIYIIGAAIQEPPVKSATDYNKIYEALSPKEI